MEKRNGSALPKMERRFFRTEVRVARKDGGGEGNISGYAAVFNDKYVYEDFWSGATIEERIMPGAFKRALKEKQDVRCLFNHDNNYILGRTKSGTLELSEDKEGLAYDCEPPNSPMANSIVASIQRGDVDGSSFGFRVVKQEWEESEDKDGHLTITRSITDVDLYDVSPVVFPAYEGTSVEARKKLLFPDGVPEEIAERVALHEQRKTEAATAAAATTEADKVDADRATEEARVAAEKVETERLAAEKQEADDKEFKERAQMQAAAVRADL